MKSIDPWSVIAVNEYGEIVVPRSAYGHPFYKDVPSWLNSDGSRYRTVFEGAFIGADLPKGVAMLNNDTTPSIVARKGLLADVAPLVAPATGGITVKTEFDDNQVLHVEICVDGQCYRTSMALGPVIGMLMQKLARWHDRQHTVRPPIAAPIPVTSPSTPPPPSTVVSTVDDAIGVASDGMVAALVGRHVDVMMGGWLSDIGGAIGGTLRTLGPVISTVATGVATYYGGPAAGATAQALVPKITEIQANLLDPKGDPSKKQAAQQQAQQLQQQAAANPALAQALAVANKAVKNTAIAYHVKNRAQKAASGDTSAQADLNHLVNQAEQGDPAAKSTFEVLANVLGQKLTTSETGAKLWEQIMGRGSGTVSSGWYDIVGNWYDIRTGCWYPPPSYTSQACW